MPALVSSACSKHHSPPNTCSALSPLVGISWVGFVHASWRRHPCPYCLLELNRLFSAPFLALSVFGCSLAGTHLQRGLARVVLAPVGGYARETSGRSWHELPMAAKLRTTGRPSVCQKANLPAAGGWRRLRVPPGRACRARACLRTCRANDANFATIREHQCARPGLLPCPDIDSLHATSDTIVAPLCYTPACEPPGRRRPEARIPDSFD